MSSDEENLSKESVRNLIVVPVEPPPKTPIYHSKYSRKVREDRKKVKDHHRTMGFPEPKTPLSPAQNFQRKHSSASHNRHHSAGTTRRHCKLKGPTITKTSKPTPRKANDFITENKLNSTQLKPPSGSLKEVDKHTGQYVRHVGLRPHYIYHKNFGKVPSYLKKMKEEPIQKKEEEPEPKPKPDYRLLSQQERQEILESLTANLKRLQLEHSRLPVLCDTIPQILRKSRIEKELNDLEKEIHTIDSNQLIYIQNT